MEKKIGALIIAAGQSSSREGFPPLEQVGKLSQAERILVNFRSAGVEDIVIVTGARARELEHSLRQKGAVFLYNKDYENTEMFDSARMGLEYMKERCSRILFTTVTVPLFTENTIRHLLSSTCPVAIPVYQGRRGHPVMIKAEALDALLAYRGEGGLRRAIDASGLLVDWVETEDPGILKQAETKDREAYGKLLEHHNRQLLHLELDIGLARETRFFDGLTQALLVQIQREGSIREGCRRLNLSYSKGLHMLEAAEEELGFALTQRQQGGSGGGQTVLTQRGEAFLNKYRDFSREVGRLANERFRELFEKGQENPCP